MSEELVMPVVGQRVSWSNSVGKKFDALVTAVWSRDCINLVYVTDDTNQTDTYGQKIVRETSQMRKSEMSAHGQFWEG